MTTPLENKFNLVSSLYGPGTLTAWYLTVTSVIVSWAFHPRKRKEDTIDVDLIAVITIPVVAAGHLVSQVRFLLVNENVDDSEFIQLIAATEAAFNVTESFLTVAVVLFMIAAWMFCMKRATFALLSGLFCFAAECYVYFSRLGLKYRPGIVSPQSPTFSRSFVADFTGLIFAILVTLMVCGIIAVAFMVFMMIQQKKLNGRVDAEQSRNNATRTNQTSNMNRERTASEDRYFRFITVVSLVFLPVALVVSFLPPIMDIAKQESNFPNEFSLWQVLEQYTSRLGHGLFPQSGCSIQDLDQAVAATAGASGLGFRMYSAVNEYYKRWGRKTSQIERNSRVAEI